MNALAFTYSGLPVRTAGTPDEPLFVAADVCRVLEIGTEQIRRLDEDEKGLRSIQTPGGEQEMAVVNESGLYSLILGSRKPQARDFKRWVTHEVLPAIRKTGRYEVAPVQTLDFSDPLVVAQLYIKAESERREAKKQLAAQAPAVAFANQVERACNDTDIGSFAKMIAWGPNRLFKELRKRGILFYRDDYNVPKQELIQRGYFVVRETARDGYTHVRTMLTGKGQLWLARILKVNITPMLLDDVSSQSANDIDPTLTATEVQAKEAVR